MKSTLRAVSMFIALALTGAFAQAGQVAPNGYLSDSDKDVVKSGTGLCWHTGYWTPADAIAGCDGVLAKAPAAANASSASAAAPAAAVSADSKPATTAAVGSAVTASKVTFETDTFFAFDKAVLQPAGKAKLEDLVSKLQGTDIEVVVATGHTDSIGSDAYNQKLSMRRANAVRAFLISKGLPANRVFAEGKGEKQPVASNKTADGRAKNRRVEVEVVGKRSN
ncbi:MAG: OmpA family protein [Burkholderiaceae bacterium]|jgi:OOP family OmpA-OmpF porin